MYHPQTNGQTEIVNQYIAQQLHPFVNQYHDNWLELLPMMDFAGVTLPHKSTGLSPFQVEFEYELYTFFDWQNHTEKVVSIEKLNCAQTKVLAERIKNIWKFTHTDMAWAQKKQKKKADRHYCEVDFNVEDKI